METLLKEQILKQAIVVENYQGNESDIVGAEKSGKYHGFIAGAEWAIKKLEAEKYELLEALEKVYELVTDFTEDYLISLMKIEDVTEKAIQKYRK